MPGDVSSQFYSGLLLSGPCLPDGLVIEVTTPLVSRPYVELTAAVMSAFGAFRSRRLTARRSPSPPAVTGPGHYQIEPDATAASYFFAAAAIRGGRCASPGSDPSLQGDMGFVDFGSMGADVRQADHRTEVTGTGALRGLDADLADLSDTAQTLAVMAVLADRRPASPVSASSAPRRPTASPRSRPSCAGAGSGAGDDGWVIHPGPVQPGRPSTPTTTTAWR